MRTDEYAATCALVTGATSGIGLETARRLLAGGANVILHARSRELGEATVGRLVQDGAEPDRLHLAVADFCRLEDVRSMAQQSADRFPGLNLLVNNAATYATQKRTLTVDGPEISFQVNFLAAYLLTRLLEKQLTLNIGTRVVNVSSSVARGASITWSDLTRLRNYSPFALYGQSKLALTMFTTSLAQRWPECAVVSVDPGVARTRLREAYGQTNRGAGAAADVLLEFCKEDARFESGAHYDHGELTQPTGVAADERALLRLWKLGDAQTRVLEGV